MGAAAMGVSAMGVAGGLAGYAVKRLAGMLLLLVGVTFVVFGMMYLAPGDVTVMLAANAPSPEQVTAIRREFGLDQPPWVQYGLFLRRLGRGDLGDSWIDRRPVVPQVLDALAYTIRLAAAALALSVALGAAGGILAAVRYRSVTDGSIMTVSLLGISAPVFVTGLLLIYTFAFRLGWFPTSGAGSWRHLVLPAFTLASFLAAYNVRMMRACMLEVLGQDYVRTARAKGVRELAVLGRHALRNALVPMVTVVGLQVGLLLGGSVITETVFAYPGVGQLVVSAISARDTPLVQACVLVTASGFLLVNLLVDLSYALIDPRIRLQ
jgi:ABC-type dipeptide/oligopeptide/nickel transport system permease component